MLTQPSYQTYLDAKSFLLQGELVAFPTETVYGLGANALDPQAVAKIFQTKGRPQKNPIIVHVGDISQIADYAAISNPIEQKIIDTLMPWPITILLKKKSTIPEIVTAGSEFVGIRIPSNEVALDFLKAVDLPIAAPSANISTKPSPTTAQMVWDNFHDNIPMIIDGGSCDVGIESTVVKVEDNRVIITRPGFITQEDIQSLFSAEVSVEYAQKVSEITPGNMYKHYAPTAKVQIISTPEDITFQKNKKIAIIATQEWIEENNQILQSYPENIQIIIWWSKNNLISCAKNLFVLYHQCDQQQIDHIFIESLPEKWLWYAIMNRVKKSTEI